MTIHHPSGQEKRITLTQAPLVVTSQFLENNPGDGNFLMVPTWTTGTTEPGSSGAGLWNPEHRLIGQFSGGYSSCAVQSPDWFGRLSAAGPLAAHLDPLGLGATTLDGMYGDGSPGKEPVRSATRAATGGAMSAFSLLLGLLAAVWWCPRRDSNSHAFRRYHLKVVCLPIPPRGQLLTDA